jgi:hypothetical protein
VGMGVKWYTESELVKENTIKCIGYGLYNPFDVPVMGYVEPTNTLVNISSIVEPILVLENTSSTNAIPVEICFNIPKVYKQDCILGMFCERTCPETSSVDEPYKNEVRFEGDVVGKYLQLDQATGATGSKTGSSVAVPLELVVICQPKERNDTLMYITFAIVIIALIAIIWLIIKQAKNKNTNKKRK